MSDTSDRPGLKVFGGKGDAETAANALERHILGAAMGTEEFSTHATASGDIVAAVCEAFEGATGWRLTAHKEMSGSSRVALAEKVAEKGPGMVSGAAACDWPAADALAGAITELLTQRDRARLALRHREAELAAGAPVIRRSEGDEDHLAQRLALTLKGTTEGVGCDAAGLYLLDEGTTQLKLRADWNLAEDSYELPARPLAGAIADLEALTGQAVALDDVSKSPSWRPPVSAGAALCVPVSTPTIELGTLWLFCREARKFSDRDTHLAEIGAGKIASELECETLLAEKARSRRVRVADVNGPRLRTPVGSPRVDGWDVAGACFGPDAPAGVHFDWWLVGGQLGMLVAADSDPPRGDYDTGDWAMDATSLAVKAHSPYAVTASDVLGRVSETLYASSPGGVSVAASAVLLEPVTGRARIASAGLGSVMLRRPFGIDGFHLHSSALGGDEGLHFPEERQLVARGDALLMVAGPLFLGRREGESAMRALRKWFEANAAAAADTALANLRKRLNKRGKRGGDRGAALLAMRR